MYSYSYHLTLAATSFLRMKLLLKTEEISLFSVSNQIDVKPSRTQGEKMIKHVNLTFNLKIGVA